MKINIILTTTSLSVVLISALIFSDGISVVVLVEGTYSKDKIGSGCGKAADNPYEVQTKAWPSMDSAISSVVDGSPNTCVCATGSSFYAVANCTSTLPMEDCKQCLDYAEYHVVVDECRGMHRGWLSLADCYVRYDTSEEECEQPFMV